MLKIYKFECPYCPKEFKGKAGFERCCNHIDKKHPQYAGHYPINKCVAFVNGEWRPFIP